MGARISNIIDKQINDITLFAENMILLDKVLVKDGKDNYLEYSEDNHIYECIFENEKGDNLLVQLKEYERTGNINEVGVEFVGPVFNEFPVMSKVFHLIENKLKNFI